MAKFFLNFFSHSKGMLCEKVPNLSWFSMRELRILTRRTRQEVRMQSERTSRMRPGRNRSDVLSLESQEIQANSISPIQMSPMPQLANR